MEVPVRTMRAAILHTIGQPLAVDTVKLPTKLCPGQVFVEVLYTGICGSQVGEIKGVKGQDPFLPHLLGHEATARVISCGPGVRHVAPDDLVILHWRPGKGIDAEPAVYEWRGERLNGGQVTTFSEYSVVSENRMTKIDSSVVDLEAASLLGCAVTTAFGVIANNARVTPGESVVVIGAGGVGLSVIEAARLVSAHPIVAIDRIQAKLQIAAKLGATHTINVSDSPLLPSVAEILGPEGADVVVENTGVPSLIEEAYSLAGRCGRVILVGVPPAGSSASIHTLPLHFGRILTGSHGGDSNPAKDIPRLIKLISQGKIKLTELVTNRCTLDNVNNAIADMIAGRIAGRCVMSCH